MLRFAIVGGLGKRGEKIAATLTSFGSVAAIIDPLVSQMQRHEHPGTFFCRDVPELPSDLEIDCWIISVPHHLHEALTLEVLEKGKPVIKEKPFALSARNGRHLMDKALQHRAPTFTITQRNANPVFQHLPEGINRIGRPYSFLYRYFLETRFAETTWRSRRDQAFRGVAFDMGYHAFDIILRTFGMPSAVTAAAVYHNDDTRGQRLEDGVTTHLIFGAREALVGTVILDRNRSTLFEELEIFGTEGSVCVTPKSLVVKDLRNVCIYECVNPHSDIEIIERQIGMFVAKIGDLDSSRQDMLSHIATLELIGRVYGALSV
jgi:predicted dehydrogenase